MTKIEEWQKTAAYRIQTIIYGDLDTTDIAELPDLHHDDDLYDHALDSEQDPLAFDTIEDVG